MTTTNIPQLKFNKLTESQYQGTTPVEGEFYLTPEADYALDSEVVHNTGNESVGGQKILNNNSNPNLIIKANTIDVTTPPAESNDWSGIQFNDKNNNRIFKIEPWHNPSGVIGCNLNVSRYINDAWSYNTFTLQMDASGNKTAYLDGKLIKAFVKETWNSGTNWYRVWSDNWIEQGGILTVTTTATVTFHKAFSNTNYNAHSTPTAQPTNATSDNNYECHILSRTSTNMVIKYYDSDSTGARTGEISWRACGY